MSATPQRSHEYTGSMSIGTVIDRLRSEFPDVTVSKIRFLESEGLITPERTASGYRRFSIHDVERLRYVLTVQRDHYLPLKVIKERLDARDSSNALAKESITPPRHLVDVTKALEKPLLGNKQVRISLESFLERSDISDEFLAELRRSNLIIPDNSGFYSEDDIDLAIIINSLSKYGIEIRHLRSYKSTADRQADLIAQIVTPRFKSVIDGRARAEDLANELAVETERLYRLLLKASLKRAMQ